MRWHVSEQELSLMCTSGTCKALIPPLPTKDAGGAQASLKVLRKSRFRVLICQLLQEHGWQLTPRHTLHPTSEGWQNKTLFTSSTSKMTQTERKPPQRGPAGVGTEILRTSSWLKQHLKRRQYDFTSEWSASSFPTVLCRKSPISSSHLSATQQPTNQTVLSHLSSILNPPSFPLTGSWQQPHTNSHLKIPRRTRLVFFKVKAPVRRKLCRKKKH